MTNPWPLRSASLVIAATWVVTLAGGWNDMARAAVSALDSRQSGRTKTAGSHLASVTVLSSDELGMPTQIVTAGDELLLVDRFRPEAIYSVARRSGELIRSFGRSGEGPGELKTPVSLVVSGSSVAVLDAGLNRVSWLAASPESPGFSLLGTTQLRIESAATGLSLTSDDQFIVTGFLGSGRLAYVSTGGEVISYPDGPRSLKRLPPDRLSELFQGSLRSSPDRSRHILTGRFSSRIDVIDDETLQTTVTWGPVKFEPHAGRYETRFGYLDSAPMADGYLALYSGRTRRAYPGRANYAGYVHEFSWAGELRAIHRLDADVITIAWSEPDRKLYAVRHDPVPAILEYSIPP